MDERVVKKYGMKVKIKKIEVTKIEGSSNERITVDGAILQQVEELKYLERLLLAIEYSDFRDEYLCTNLNG